jgi:hypothetical protein
MWYDSTISNYADINYKINKIYCDKYGYDLIRSNEINYKERSRHWERLPLILKYIKNYDYIIWIDADAHFYIDSPPITNIINKFDNKLFIFSKDINSSIYNSDVDYNINSGFFIVKNNPISINILNEWAYSSYLYENRYPKHLDKKYNDQGALQLMYDENILNIKDVSVVIPYGILQHFNSSENINIFKFSLTNKPFIIHYAGENNDTRYNHSLKYYNSL